MQSSKDNLLQANKPAKVQMVTGWNSKMQIKVSAAKARSVQRLASRNPSIDAPKKTMVDPKKLK